MKLVRSGFRHQADFTGGFSALLRPRGAGLDLEFLHRVGKRHRQVGTLERVVVVRPVEFIAQAGIQTARNRDVSLSKRIARASIQQHRWSGGSCQRNEFRYIASVQREIQDSGIFHNLTDSRVPGLNKRRVRLNLDVF